MEGRCRFEEVEVEVKSETEAETEAEAVFGPRPMISPAHPAEWVPQRPGSPQHAMTSGARGSSSE